MKTAHGKGEREGERQAAERLHRALCLAWKALYPALNGARVEERTGYLFLVCPELPFPQCNGVWAEGPEEEEAVRELDGAIIEIESLGLPCWVQTRLGRTPAIEAEARRLGLTAETSVPGMVATPDDLRQVESAGVEITRVEDADSLAVARNVAAAAFEVSPDLFAPFYNPRVAALPGFSVYVGWFDDEPVSTAIGWTGLEAVGIFNVATPAQHRGQGYGMAVTARAVADGFASGASLAWLQSSPLGESVYRRIGFRQVETYTLLSRPQATDGNG